MSNCKLSNNVDCLKLENSSICSQNIENNRNFAMGAFINDVTSQCPKNERIFYGFFTRIKMSTNKKNIINLTYSL